MQGGAGSQSSGIMIRETLTPGSTNAYAATGSSSLIYFNDRPATGGNSSFQSSSASVTLPYWVKLVRSGNTFSGYSSADGVNWTAVGSSQTIPMAANVFVGLAVSSNVNSSLTTATFDNVTVTAPPTSYTLSASPSSLSVAPGASGTSTITVAPQNGFNSSVNLAASGQPSGVTAAFNPTSTTGSSVLTLTTSSGATPGTYPITVTGVSGSLTSSVVVTLTVTSTALPTGWADLDIGSVGLAGSASYANGTYTVNASGQFIWSTADGFNFAYLPVTGDVTVVARLVSMQGGASSQSSGIMIRETLTPGSTNAYAATGSSSLIYFNDRATTGGDSSFQSSSASVTLPYWVKLVRSGNTFSGYGSADGVNWTAVGSSQTIPMAANVYVGLAVSSNVNSSLTIATFDNVSVTP
jgi:hypothetical protein